MSDAQVIHLYFQVKFHHNVLYPSSIIEHVLRSALDDKGDKKNKKEDSENRKYSWRRLVVVVEVGANRDAVIRGRRTLLL